MSKSEILTNFFSQTSHGGYDAMAPHVVMLDNYG